MSAVERFNQQAGVTISRSSNNVITIRIRDELSREVFVECEISLENFALLVTGQAEIPSKARYSGLENVGKQKVIEKRSISCPLETYNKDELSDWLVANASEEGWTINNYLGSQGSVRYIGGQMTLNYTVHRYIESYAMNHSTDQEGSRHG